MLTRLNDAIALRMTRAFGTMGMFYLFALYGILPAFAVFHPYQDTMLYYSNVVQLIALPLLMVGTNLMGRAAELRAEQDHAALIEMHDEVLQVLELLRDELSLLQKPDYDC